MSASLSWYVVACLAASAVTRLLEFKDLRTMIPPSSLLRKVQPLVYLLDIFLFIYGFVAFQWWVPLVVTFVAGFLGAMTVQLLGRGLTASLGLPVACIATLLMFAGR